MYSIDLLPDHRIAIFKFWDMMTAEEGKRAFLDYVSHPDFRPDFRMLSDARRVTRIEADFNSIFSGVLGVAGGLRRFERPTPSVILVQGDVAFGVARMLEQILDFTSRIRLRVVSSESEAALQLQMESEEVSTYLNTPRRAANEGVPPQGGLVPTDLTAGGIVAAADDAVPEMKVAGRSRPRRFGLFGGGAA